MKQKGFRFCTRRSQVTFVLLTLALAALGRGHGVSRRRALADAVAAPGGWPPAPVSGSPQPLHAPFLRPLPSDPQGLSSHSSCFLEIKGCVLPELGRNSSCWFVERCPTTPQPPAPSSLLELLRSLSFCAASWAVSSGPSSACVPAAPAAAPAPGTFHSLRGIWVIWLVRHPTQVVISGS